MRALPTVRLLFAFPLCVLLLCVPARAAVVYVNKNAPGAVHNGTSWATAFQSVQAGVNASVSGDEVWVATGTYSEYVTISKSASLYGGFAGTEAQRGERDWAANATVINGGGATKSVTSSAQQALIDGFTVRNNGAGYVSKSCVDVISGTATIANCAINQDASDGDGVSVKYGTAFVDTCAISAGKSGVLAVHGTATVSNCVVKGCGSGVTAYYDGVATIRSCALVANGAGVISSASGYVTVTNCTLSGNGTGVNAYWGRVSIFNSILAFNGKGIFGDYSRYGVGGTLSHSVVYGNTTANNDGYHFQTQQGNVSADPLFVDRAGGDYHLKPGSPCIDAGDDSAVAPGDTDLGGNPRIVGPHVDIGAFEFLPSLSASLGTPIQAAPSVVDGVVYAGGENGKLYALTSPALTPVPGFPVDIAAAVGAPVKLNSRPAVYYGKAGKAVYLTTDVGHVVKVWPDGRVAWVSHPLSGPTMSTPAVTPDGNVYVDLCKGSDPVSNFVFKLDETSGVPASLSPYLGPYGGALIDRSAAIDQRYCYVNASYQWLGSLAVLNQDNLMVRASFAPGEEALPPFLNGASVYVATKGGSVYRVNSVTMNADLGFGSLGRVKMGEAVTAGPFLDSGVVYLGTASGRVWKLNGVTGVKSLFLDSGTNSAITGLLVTRGIVAFGTASATLQQVAVASPAIKTVETLSGPPAGGPVYDPVQRRFIIATTGGQVYSVPGM